jgi:hypothetical protein
MRKRAFARIACTSCLIGGLVAAGCGAEDDDVGADREAIGPPSSHHFVQAYGGNIFSMPFVYVTEDGLSSGDCTFGYQRPAAARVQWTSQAGGNCGFVVWDDRSDPHNCRAIIVGSTGGAWFGGQCESWVDEIPDPLEGSIAYAAKQTNSATQNTTDVFIALAPGQMVTVATCGQPGSSTADDTYLRLFDEQSNQLAANDDAPVCGSFGSMTSYQATTSEVIRVRAGCYANTSCTAVMSWIIRN